MENLNHLPAQKRQHGIQTLLKHAKYTGVMHLKPQKITTGSKRFHAQRFINNRLEIISWNDL